VGDRIVEGAIDRAYLAICRVPDPLADPLFPAALLRGFALVGRPWDGRHLLETWTLRASRETGAARYPWAVSPRFCDPFPAWIPPRSTWRPERPRDLAAFVAEPGLGARFADRLVEAPIVADTAEFLATAAAADDGRAPLARTILDEQLRKLRRDAASWSQELHASGDTWALAALARRPAALGLLYPFALATAEEYAASAIAAGDIVRGTRFPFHGVPLASASAALASGLVALGIHPKLTGRIVARVLELQQPDGGWGDDGPSDLLTTLLVARLVGALDPRYDPLPAARYVACRQRSDGWWHALGPETAWLTVEIVEWLLGATRPFAERFAWPHLATVNRDRRTGLPSFAYFADVQRLFAEVPGLRTAPVELAFIDLAGFGAFNNRFGMAMGDAALRAFAQALDRDPGSITIRDGGDEFIVVGAPTGRGLPERLRAFRAAWPDEFRRRFPGAEAVAPRILTAETTGAELVAARDALGRLIAELKARSRAVGQEGIQLDLGAGEPAGAGVR
jgi:GGDEF domain-containing protein